MEFYLYKGLKKPLVFFGLKGKYLYWGGGFSVGGFICTGILTNIFGLIGILIGSVIIGGGIWFTFFLQDKKGLYNKTKNNNELHIFPNSMKNKNIIRK